MSEDIDYSNATFEDFNKLIDESHDDGCGHCFSFSHYKHLDESTRKVAYHTFLGNEVKRVKLLASELDRLKAEPINDNIYFLVMQAEELDTNDLKSYMTIRDSVLARAKEMIEKKMGTAWVAVRAYACIKGANLAVLPDFLNSTDDLDVWQVSLQCMQKSLLSLPELFHCRDQAYKFTVKAIEMDDAVKPYVVAVNGVQALMRLLDERALELWHKLPRHSLDRTINEQADWLISQLTKERQSQYIPVLMELKQLTEKTKTP